MNTEENLFDFVAIGDTVTDAFIRLEDAMVDADKNMLCMRFKDKIPYKDVTVVAAVGNSANAAASSSRLGLKTALITNLGADDWGKECLDVLTAEKIDTRFITQHEGKKTNYHYVLWFGDDRTILVKHEEYDYILPGFGSPKWVYLSSLGGNSLPYHQEIIKYLSERPEIKLAFQPGTYQMKFGREALKGIYERSDLFFCNKEEAQRILGSEESNVKNLLSMMRSIGPRTVFITDGKEGAYAYDGADIWQMPMHPDPKPPLSRTGAGDAFSSTCTVAIALGMPLERAIMWGPVNSMSVVQQIGARAGLLTRKKLEEYLANAPEDYKPRKI